jgi:DNA modification methylase
MQKYFYEKGNVLSWPCNITYGELVTYDDKKFSEWVEDLRMRFLKDWDENGKPPLVGRSEDEIIQSFSKLRQFNSSKVFHNPEKGNDADIIGVIANFSKNGSAANQFFPTMLKTKIASGTNGETSRSIYDFFTDEMKDTFHHVMRRTLYNDSMYLYSKSISSNQIKNPYFREGETLRDFFLAFKNGDGRFDGQGLRISKISCTLETYNKKYTKYLTIKADQIREFVKDGILDESMIFYLGDIDELSDNFMIKKDGEEPRVNVFLVRVYEKSAKLFPQAFQIFRISFSQPAVNFPPMTAKFLYEHFTKHIPASEMVTVYDPSAGWGGRILGAMSVSRPIHYVGTDPNTDNSIPELGTTRYEYLADFYLKSIGEKGSSLSSRFFDVKEDHTYDVFQDGSELIQNNPKFQKYEGKLDFVFTSPPYFNREMYSDDDTQSYKSHGEYADWRDNFLRPTLETSVRYLKNDRYLCWNIANIKVSATKTINLEEDSINILKSLGMEYKGKMCMLMTKMIGNSDPERLANKVLFNGEWFKHEPIFVFYKP